MNRHRALRVQRATAWAALLVGIAGCHTFRDDKGIFVDPRDDYLDAVPSTPLVVPENMASVRIQDSWPIPEIVGQPVAKTFPNDPPQPKMLVGRNLDAVRIQRLGTRSWIVSGNAPSQVWPQIKQFLLDSRVGIDVENPPSGVVETSWLRLAEGDDAVREAIREGLANRQGDVEADEPAETAADGVMERVYVRVERGIRQGSSEVHVVHSRQGPDGEMPAVAEVETELIAELADYLAAAVASGPVSMVGRDIASESKARIAEDETGAPVLILNVDFERAYATIEQAINRAELGAVEADRDRRLFRVVLGQKPKEGLFARIIPGGGGDLGPSVSIELAATATGIEVSVRGEGEEPIDRALAQEILRTLREFAA